MEIIEFNRNLGEFFLFKEDDLLNSDSFQEQSNLSQKVIDELINEISEKHQFIFNDKMHNNIGIIIKHNDGIKIKLIDLSILEGFNLIYEKPAKGGGIINLSVKNKDNSESLLYAYIKVNKDPISGWNYTEWNKKINNFEKNILEKIKEWTEKEVLSIREYSNC